MCGICGIYDYSNTGFKITESLIKSMRDTMIHRGPDDKGVWISSDRKVGLGFRRLAIIDLTKAGNQPMSNEDSSIWIVFNGEIYNHLALRKELENQGHRYRSHTDVETVIHAYEEWGIKALDKFEGMFAFALWDGNKREMYLVRDRIGIKPLYYAFVNGTLVFGSEIKAILEHPEVQRDINPVALYHYLTFLVPPAPLTMFKGIYKLPAGHYMKIDSTGQIEISQYWDAIVPDGTYEYADEGRVIETIRQLLAQSIEKRMMSDVPFGVFLSGGIDSSLNVALMARVMDRPVDTFSVGFADYEKYNEFKYARQIAKQFKTNHHEVLISSKDLVSYITSLVYHQDEPIADWVCVPLYYVSKLARDNGTIVIQVGEGSDELFCGYEHYIRTIRQYLGIWRMVNQLPLIVRKTLAWTAGIAANAVGKGLSKVDFLRRAAEGEDLFWGGAICCRENVKPLLVKMGTLEENLHEANTSHPRFSSKLALGYNLLDHNAELSSYEVVKTFLSNFERKKPKADYLAKMIYLELKQRLPELLLMRVDKITMSTSVEGRVPFLDHKLVEYVINMPMSLKIKNNTPKYILKRAAEGIIPQNIIYRRKQGFGAPVSEWFREELGAYAEEAIMRSRLRERQLFNYDYIQNMLDEHRSGRANYGLLLWLIFNLSRWYDYWIA